LKSLGNQAVISNAFILYLRPGLEILKKGIKNFMKYHGVNVTDSGGFQMYTESFLKKITDDCVVFESPFDGTKHKVTPEQNMEIQHKLGSDVAMCLDVMPNFHGVEREEIEEAVRRTTLWAKRCKEAHDKLKSKQLLFGISQGGIHADLREQSVKELLPLDFDGYACGGLGMGEPVEERYKAVELQRSLLPDNKVLYLMGIGSPVELIEAVALGADMFDSRFPTQNARRGTIFTSQGKLRIKRKEYEADESPLDENCDCFVCKTYSRAYLRHLLIQNEGSGYRLVTYHQLHYLMQLMKNIRKSISEGTFVEFRKQILAVYKE
jgi:queuine tRNA-ribosyltransferase